MKNVLGGDDQIISVIDGAGGTCVKCCWTGTNTCSVGTVVSDPSLYTCTGGATMKTC